MANYDQNSIYGARARTGSMDMSVDQGLRSYMLGIYNYMAAGLAITGVVAYLTYAMAVVAGPAGEIQLTQFGAAIYTSPLRWVVMLAPLAFVMVLSFGINRLSAGTTQMLFWAFASVMGLSLSWIFLTFTGESITQVFLVTAIAFGGLSLYGYTTKKDLSGWGSFLIMGLIGIIAASIVNLFLQSSALHFAVSVIGVLVFAGLTAYDTQRLKTEYYVGDSGEIAKKKSIMGALSLYLNFINMFMMMLSLFGQQR